jgi:hypothetical protein
MGHATTSRGVCLERRYDAYRWLVSVAARPWLEMASESAPVLPTAVTRMRRELSADQVSLVCEQANLRKRAAIKFARAAEMFFTPSGLEQATDEQVAAYKASQFPAHSRVADFCCGIGGDLIAMAARCEVVGVDHDPISALLAEANVSVHGFSQTRVRCTDVTEQPLSKFSAWHIDPDRRPGNHRTTSIEHQQPSWSMIEELVARCPHAAIKLAPAAELPNNVARAAELEWIGSRRQCKQLLVRYGDLARYPGQRTATIVCDDSRQTETVKGDVAAPISHRERVGSYLYEPHAALLAAHIVPAVAEPLGLQSFAVVTPGGGAMWGYLTSDDVVEHPAFERFRVLEVLPFDRKRLVMAARQKDWCIQEIKKRGVRETPAQIRAWLDVSGGTSVTLIVAPTSLGVRAIFAERF